MRIGGNKTEHRKKSSCAAAPLRTGRGQGALALQGASDPCTPTSASCPLPREVGGSSPQLRQTPKELATEGCLPTPPPAAGQHVFPEGTSGQHISEATTTPQSVIGGHPNAVICSTLIARES